MSVTFKELAYARIILHAARYPHCSVSGILLSKLSDSKEKSLVIENAVPLFHHSLTLTPMLEVAFNHIDVYCNKENLYISGYYQINECIDKNGPTSCAYKIADKINEVNENSCLLMVKNNELASEDVTKAFAVYRVQEGRWKETSGANIENTAPAKTRELLRIKAQKYLVDFDSHLDNIVLSWPSDAIRSILEKILV